MKSRTNRWPRLRGFLRARRAVSALEYAILVGVIAVGFGVALAAFNDEIKTTLQNVQKNLAASPGLGSNPTP